LLNLPEMQFTAGVQSKLSQTIGTAFKPSQIHATSGKMKAQAAIRSAQGDCCLAADLCIHAKFSGSRAIVTISNDEERYMARKSPPKLPVRQIGSTIVAVAFAACAAFSLASQPVSAAEFSPSQKTEIESILKNYLLQNPEVLRDAIGELEKREKAAENAARDKIVSDAQSPLYTSPHQAIIGNPNGKVTLVEFFDYNCGYCKRALGDLARLLKEDPDLRVVLRDFPILSEGSIEAAQIEAAARLQFKGEKFWDFHQKLLGSRGAVGKAQALAVAKEAGADMDKLAKDAAEPSVKAGIEESDKLGRQLALTGTPSYVIGDEVVVGAVGYDQLKAKLDNVRKCGKAACS
jgi:protein-disulfide isomerase